jgi:hypothetical protein
MKLAGSLADHRQALILHNGVNLFGQRRFALPIAESGQQQRNESHEPFVARVGTLKNEFLHPRLS